MKEKYRARTEPKTKRQTELLEKAKFIPVLLGKGALYTLILKTCPFSWLRRQRLAAGHAGSLYQQE